MRFRDRPDSSIPTINLIPMLNVLLGVLAFFVIITMTLGQSQSIHIQLPAEADEVPPPPESPEAPVPPLMVTLTRNGQYVVDETPVPPNSVEGIVSRYLASDDEVLVFLLADPDVPYDDVIAFLVQMKQVGGDRVSLALEDPALTTPEETP
ncbi:MAG: ExbD/TolR family protein [Leptolyngbyaceae cyanobacterium]